jgi:hypothetical protein
MSRQRRANSICAGVAPGCWSAVGQWELIVSHSLRPVQRQARHPHPVGPPLEQLVARHAPAEVVAGRGDVAVQAQVHAKGQFPHGVSLPVSRYSAYRPTRRGKFIGQTTPVGACELPLPRELEPRQSKSV